MERIVENKSETFYIEQPQEIKASLFPHQLVSVYEMEERERTKQYVDRDMTIDMNISIQADKMGYGKTLSLVTLIYRNKMEWDLTTRYCQTDTSSFSDGRVKKTVSKYYDKLDVTLVLAGHSIINQWYDEFYKSPLCIKKILTAKDICDTLIENYDVVIVVPTMYNKLLEKYHGMAWKRFVYDEPTSIKVGGMKKIVAGFTWLVTATPLSLISSYRTAKNNFLYDISNILRDLNNFETSNHILIKNSDSFVENSFRMPPTHHHYYKCYNPLYRALHGLVNPRISDMISGGNIKGAIQYLGGKETDNITELIRTKKEKEIEEYNLIIQIMSVGERHVSRTKYINELNEKIKVLNTQINELNSRYKMMLEGDCNICYDKLENPVMESTCQNIFCGKCLLKWMETKNNCPLCRESITPEKLIYIQTKEEKEKQSRCSEKENVKTTKIEKVLSLIKSKPEGKFIIFSSWDQTFSPIREMLKLNDITFIEIKGGVSTREANLNSYKSGNVNVIFLNSENNGSGINLPETTDLIIYHEMEQHTISQIIGRANRIGRTHSLNVHHLVLE